MPDSLQIGHLSVRHDSISSRTVTLAGYVWSHSVTHALAPRQPIAQLSRLLHSVDAAHAAICVQQLSSAHTSHCDPEDPALQTGVAGVTLSASSNELSPPPGDAPPVMIVEQPAASVATQLPFCGGRDSEEHASSATSATAARTAEVHLRTPTTNHATPGADGERQVYPFRRTAFSRPRAALRLPPLAIAKDAAVAKQRRSLCYEESISEAVCRVSMSRRARGLASE
jgi:hypothetical protein